MDLSDPKEYCERMISLSPKGLLPAILDVKKDKVYSFLLGGYQAYIDATKLSC
jgi:hypothetical protein